MTVVRSTVSWPLSHASAAKLLDVLICHWLAACESPGFGSANGDAVNPSVRDSPVAPLSGVRFVGA